MSGRIHGGSSGGAGFGEDARGLRSTALDRPADRSAIGPEVEQGAAAEHIEEKRLPRDRRLEQTVVRERVTPEGVAILLEVRAQCLCSGGVDRTLLDHRQEHLGVAHAHPANIGRRVAATVPVEGDAHDEDATVGVNVEVGEHAATLQAEAEVTWPARQHRRVERDVHGPA